LVTQSRCYSDMLSRLAVALRAVRPVALRPVAGRAMSTAATEVRAALLPVPAARPCTRAVATPPCASPPPPRRCPCACRQLTVREALNAAMDEEMARDSRVFLMGARRRWTYVQCS
jgi:hypothetical protein